MRDWHLTQADPLTLRLAADARLAPTDYANDHIWELSLTGGDPPALALRTTYGLRAQDMRLFHAFADGDAHVTDPADFAAPPEVRAFFAQQRPEATFVHSVGHVAESIADLAQEGKFDLIVMGSRGHSDVVNLVLGSVATKVLAKCTVPVLLVR